MNRLIVQQQLQDTLFDICIIGGGATGAGCALDAALRGLKVALIERSDFAAATSSKSTKLVHGGVRYLEQAFKKLDWEQFQMVRKALKERSTVLRNAPHLAQPLALLTPCSSGIDTLYYGTGLKIYDWIAGDNNLLASDWLSKEDALGMIPQLKASDLHSAVLYYDGQLDDARYGLALVKSAQEAGAVVLNHAQINNFSKNPDGRLQAATVQDQLSGEAFLLRAKVFVNATGPFADHIRTMANPEVSPRMRVSKGVHVVLPGHIMPTKAAILVPKTDDGRVIFIIPWQGQLLVGTTDTEDTLSEAEPLLLSEEVDYLLEYVNRYLAQPVSRSDVRSGFSGLRPLLQASPDADTKQLVRDHEVEINASSGLVSIMGGKWTTYRLMAKDTIDECYPLLGQPLTPCQSEQHLLYGAEGYTPELWEKIVERYPFSEATAKHLCQKYGGMAIKVAELALRQPQWAERLHPDFPIVGAEVAFVVQHEMAFTIRDVLARRIGLELWDWQVASQTAPVVAAIMAELLGWSQTVVEQQTEAYQQLIEYFRKKAGFGTL
jgi:glycerol-3-phosphate dehydrogenase